MAFKLSRFLSCALAVVMLSASGITAVSADDNTTVTSASVGALAAPRITGASKSVNSVTLKWSKVKGASGYKVYKLVGKKYKSVGTIRSGSKVRFKIKDLKSGKKYSFKVRAFKKTSGKTAWSRYSSARSVTTKADYSLYEPVLKLYFESQGSDNCYYFLFDMNNDGIKELVIHGKDTDQYNENYHSFTFYTYNCGDPKYIDTVGTLHQDIMRIGYSDHKKLQILVFEAGQYIYWNVNSFYLRDGKIVKKTKCSKGYTSEEECLKDGYAQIKHTMKSYKLRNGDKMNTDGLK